MKTKRKVNELIIDPKIITKSSPISGCAKTRRIRREVHGVSLRGDELGGDWDQTKKKLSKDFLLFKNNQAPVYNWKPLYESIKNRGYNQTPNSRYIEVGLGRTGEVFLVDGRHRLACVQDLNIPEVPVDVVYVHPEYNFGNLNSMKNKVIPKVICDKIVKRWDKNASIYQPHGSIQKRFGFTAKYLPLLKGANVLDVGCNAGMMIWSIMRYAEGYIGLERHPEYYEQCRITLDCLKSLWKDKPIVIHHARFQDHNIDQEQDFNALVASFVLYHLNANEISLLKEKVLPRCKTVIIPTRAKERKSNINNLFLNREESVTKLFSDCGFTTKVYRNRPNGYFVLVGEKK